MYTTFLLTIGIISAGFAMGAVALVRRTRAAQRADDAWARVADRLHGTFSKQGGNALALRTLATRELSASVEGQRVVMDELTVREGMTKAIQTRIAATASYSEGLELCVWPKGAPSGSNRIAGAQAVRTGDSKFDRSFEVFAMSDHLARLWLDEGVRKAIASARPYGFVLRDGSVTGHHHGLEARDDGLVAAAAATARIAGRGDELARQWHRIAGNLGTIESDDRGRWPAIDASADSNSIRIVVESASDARYQTVVYAIPPRSRWDRFAIGSPRPDWARKLPRPIIEIKDTPSTRGLPQPIRSDDPPKTMTWLAEVREQIVSLRTAGLSFDGRCVRLGLDGIVLDEQRLQTAVDFAAGLCKRMGAAAYR